MEWKAVTMEDVAWASLIWWYHRFVMLYSVQCLLQSCRDQHVVRGTETAYLSPKCSAGHLFLQAGPQM